ncbi:MAG: HEAT repeat domain-containing protein [Planctomycetes bacterium]|nr:HEAT repeat domain-containing protein [Planctomycetota bacterium]
MSRPVASLVALFVLAATALAQLPPAGQPPASQPSPQEAPASQPTPPSFLDLRRSLDDQATTDLDRRRAIVQLRSLADDRVRPYLLELFGRESMAAYRAAIVAVLADLEPDDELRRLVRESLVSADFALRSAAARALVKVDPDWKRVFRRLLDDEGERSLHGNLVFAIAYSDDEGALDFLREILERHPEQLGALTISYASSRFGIEAVYKDFLQPQLRKQADENLRYAALAVLGQAKDRRFLSGLGRHLSRQERQQTATRWLPLLAGLDDPDAFQVMLEMVDKATPFVERSFLDQAARMQHPKIRAWFRDRGARMPEPCIRRAALANMRAFPEARNVPVLKKLCESDEAETVAAALSALARHARELAEPVIRKCYQQGGVQKAADALDACAELCGDDPTLLADLLQIAGQSRAWELRVVAMRLLQDHHAAEAREILLANAEHARGAVRIGAYDALTYLRDREVVDFLIGRLDHEDGRPLGELVAALTNLTGSQWGRRVERWQAWWRKVRADYPLPPRPERTVVVRDDDGQRYGFYGIDVDSTRVVFVIDTSGSMSARSNTGTTDRIYQAKNELKSALSRFGEKHAFDIIAFNGAPRAYAGRLVKASPVELDKARAWVDALQAAGGTNIYDSLDLALATDDVDTVFLLSDGAPGNGKYVDTDLILEAIRRQNRFRRIRINAIGIGVAGEARRLVETLAKENWGVSVIL